MKREELIADDRRYLWRPYTSSEDHERKDPLVVVDAEGPWLIDADGRRYLDGSGAWWCNNLGHAHPRLQRAIHEQADRWMHCSLAGTTHEPAVRLAKELVAIAPEGLERVFYSDNGSTSVEVALKIAFQYWQQNGERKRRYFLSLPGAYHGDTIGTMSVGAIDAFSGVFSPLLFETLRPEEPPAEQGFEGVIAQIEALLESRGHEIAAVIVEPLVQGAAGMRMYTPAQLRRIDAARKAAGTLLICDEVFTGFGRTGSFWASEQASVAPDLLCTAKGLSGGALPFAATLASARLYDGFRGGKNRALMHGHTFCGNPLGAAVCLEVLAIYRDERILEGIAPRSEAIAATTARLEALAGVRRSRSLGMVAAVDLGEGGYLGELGWRVHDEARTLGAQLRPLGDTVYIVPPLNIPLEDLDRLLEILERSIATVVGSK